MESLKRFTVLPLKKEKRRGTAEQPLQEQVSRMLTPYLSELATDVGSAAVRQAPAVETQL